MAIYHCSVKTIGRSGGRSAVNSAAYRSGEKLFDESLEKTFFYSGKSQDVMHKEIMAPDNVPELVFSREKLWNAVEAAEKRKDSQLAREIEISLPREFTTDQNIALVREYAEREFVDRGMVADICLHYGMKGDNYNPHAHIMLTMRSIDEQGFGKKDVSWNNRGLLNEWRESWADVCNKHLAINGFEITVDHRSLADQGIELVPQNVELPVDAKDRLTGQRERQLEIMRENGERLSADPGIVLSAITKCKSVFNDRDIAHYLNSRTVDKEQFDSVLYKVKAHEHLVQLSVKDGKSLYTTKEIIDVERNLFSDARDMSGTSGFKVKSSGFDDIGAKDNLSIEQKAAVDYICQDKNFRAVVGYAGTGKTHMLSSARQVWENSGYRVSGATLSGIAAQGLEKGSGIESTTVARKLIDWDNGRNKLSSKDVLVIDEAGMLSVRDVSRIMSEARGAGAKVVMLGDPQQLQAIEAGAAFRGVVEREGCLKMSDVQRQEITWQREATKMLALGGIDQALDKYKENGHVKYCFTDQEQVIDKMVDAWAKGREASADATETQIMLAHKKKDVAELNNKVREVLKNRGELNDGIRLNTVNGPKEFSPGDKVYFLRNDNSLAVRNGTLGEVSSVDKNSNIVVSIKEPSGERNISFNVEDYKHIDHGYAATIHKAQGITVDRSYVLASRGFNQNLTYVAMSRHVKSAEMFWSGNDFKSFNHLKWHLGKEAQKENALDYMKSAQEFSEARGIRAVYEDIKAKFIEGYNDIKNKVCTGVIDKVREARDVVGRSNIMKSLEERMEYNKGIKTFEKENKCKVSGKMRYRDNFKFHSLQKFGDKEYGFLQVSKDIYRVHPGEKCQDLNPGDKGYMTAAIGGVVAVPTEETKWNRQVQGLKAEYGKEITQDIKYGDKGIFRDTFQFGRKEYIVMEKYDKVVVIDRQDFRGSMKVGDYMKIDKTVEEFYSRKTGTISKSECLVAVRDEQKHQKIEQEKAKELVIEKTMSKEMDFGM